MLQRFQAHHRPVVLIPLRVPSVSVEPSLHDINYSLEDKDITTLIHVKSTDPKRYILAWNLKMNEESTVLYIPITSTNTTTLNDTLALEVATAKCCGYLDGKSLNDLSSNYFNKYQLEASADTYETLEYLAKQIDNALEKSLTVTKIIEIITNTGLSSLAEKLQQQLRKLNGLT